MNRWDRLLHRLGFHSVERCPALHTWDWTNGRWVPGIPVPPIPEKPRLVRTDEPELPGDPPGPPTEGMEPPRKLPDVAAPTRLIPSQAPPPGRHRPKGERIVPPRRDG